METMNLNGTMNYSTAELVGRRNRKKIKRREKNIKLFNSIKKIFSGVGSLYIILTLVSYILICQIKQNNAIVNIQSDPNIPSYVVNKVIDYLR